MIAATRPTRRVAMAVAASAATGLLGVAWPAFAQTVEVAVGNYYFEDGTVGDGRVTAKVGDQLRFTFVEGAGHTVTISALGIDTGQLPIGAVYVTPPLSTPGSYSLVCTTHRARNHATTLVVEAGSGGGGGPTTTRPPSTSAPTTTVPSTTSTTSPSTATTAGAGTPGGSSGGSSGGSPDGGTTTTAPGDDGMSTETGDQSAGGEPTGDDALLPVGVVGGDTTPWLRAVWISLGTLPVFLAAALLAEWSARRRTRSDPDR